MFLLIILTTIHANRRAIKKAVSCFDGFPFAVFFKTANGNPLKHKKPHKKTQQNRNLFKTANGNPLKHKKPHKKTHKNRNRRTHPIKHTNETHAGTTTNTHASTPPTTQAPSHPIHDQAPATQRGPQPTPPPHNPQPLSPRP